MYVYVSIGILRLYNDSRFIRNSNAQHMYKTSGGFLSSTSTLVGLTLIFGNSIKSRKDFQIVCIH